MESISRLRELLLRALNTRESYHTEQDVFDELMVQKPRLLSLLDVGGRSQQEQREIESGRTVIDGRQVAVNSDFTRQVIFLSQQLDCSERYIAGLLHNAMAENPNISPVQCLEATIAEFHQRRRHLVDCLLYLVEATEAAEAPDLPPTYARIANYVRVELLGTSAGDAFALKIFKQLEGLDSVIGRADLARKNASSNTTLPSGQGNPALGSDILNARYDSLKYERRNLAAALCSASRLGYFSPNEVKSVVDWLFTHSNHSMTFYMLNAVLLALDPADPQSIDGEIRQALATDNALMTFMTKKLGPSTEWKEPGLKATLLLKWTLFLTEARHVDSSLEHRAGFKTEELETQVWNAVQGDAFSYLALAVVQLQRKRGHVPVASIVNTLTLTQEQQELREPPPEDHIPAILSAFETLVRSLITHASSELRKIKQRQEDLVHANARTDRSRTTTSRFGGSLAPESEKSNIPPRNDIALLFSFIGVLYSSLSPERALQFWGSGPLGDSSNLSYLEYVETTAGRLPTFLQWAVWSTSVHHITMSTALYDMLGGLAKGQQCSELAYNFMARGGGEVIPGSMLPSSSSGGPSVSWTVIFGLLDSWALSATQPRTQHQHHSQQGLGTPSFGGHPSYSTTAPPQSHQVSIGPREVLLAQSFLHLLSTVVSDSVAVRVTISGHAHFRAIPTLVSLIPLGIPLELKGALFSTLAAFCVPGAGVPGVEICKAVWTLMERLEVINVRASSTGPFGATIPTLKGIEAELQEIEAPHRLYPSTIPFLKLLSTLIHTPKRVSLKDRVTDVQPINTVPEALGQPYRLPGIGPFTAFVIDNVFANIANREYSRPSDRWETNDLCLCFIERALASFDLESLVTSPEDVMPRGDALVPLLVHPGYEVMKRLLTNSPLQASILSYIVEGVEGFEKEFADEEPFFKSTIVRILRIVLRTLEIQDIFLDVLIPLLSDFDSAPVIGTLHPRSYFTRFDQALSFGPQYIPALAAYIAYPSHSELVLLSIKIASILSSANLSSNLTTLIERSGDSERIIGGFVKILSVESSDDIWEAEALADQTTGAGAPDSEETQRSLEQAIRLAALDLLIQETNSIRPFPNVAHFLLFGGQNIQQQIEDPHALGARRTSIHVLLELLNVGVPRLKGKGKERERHHASQASPLFATLPGLAERCYRVVYQLCVHPRTSDFTTRYLRTREDFFARHLASVPAQAPQTLREPYIHVLYNDGSRVTTTVPSLSSFLRLRSCIFDLAALELHILTNKGHFKGVAELLEIIFGNESTSVFGDPLEDDIFQPFNELGQSHMRIVEFLQSLMFDWSDSLTVESMNLQFLSQLNLHSCIRTDAAGCQIVDRTALLNLLTIAKKTLHAQGAIVTPAHTEQLRQEANYVLESCAVENHRREVAHGMATGYEAWRRLLDMTLTKCFDRLPHDRRENMLFDLLHVLPSAIRLPDLQETTAVLLSEAVLSCITKLREDRRHQLITQSIGGDSESGSLPAERLYSILQSIVESIIDSNRVELVRGNLYAALINYVHLIVSPRNQVDTTPPKGGDNLAISLTSSILREDLTFDTGLSLVPVNHAGKSQGSWSSLESGSLSIMKSAMERLVATVSRDAIDGTEVWKTIAFMLLDALVHLSGAEKQHIVLSALTRHGILSNFVRGIKESDSRLLSVLKPDPDDLNPLYVYEAKMSLFVRMTQTRGGAERLLEAQLIPMFAKCDYLDARPEADQSFMDQDSFLPSAIQRYHQLFMPVLQLVDGMLATLGTKHSTITNQALDFLSSHSSTIVILLKNETDQVPMALLEEIHLIITLCASVLPSVPKSELLSSNSGFGAIHSAILNLATRCLGTGRCFRHILPQSDAEIQNASTYAFGYGSKTKFDISVRGRERLLRKSIIIYVGSASEFTEPEITLLLSPITTKPRHNERGSHFLATIPTIGDALEALNSLCADLRQALKQISEISAELAARDHIGVENITEVVLDIQESFLQDLDIGQKRALICQELESIKKAARRDAKILLNTTEMLLLLIWRHIQYYAPPSSSTSSTAPSKIPSSQIGAASTNHMNTAMRFLAAPEPETFKADVGKQLGPALTKLENLNLDSESLGPDWQANHAYIEIMSRRLRDSSGLHDHEREEEMDAKSE
ncbi:nucleoporin Nup186/Nup192/Nup205 [Collybia nuda]|uniref:Nucleoporin Nup186/Nup192/Nup205 n=1 Tax=Collybia nuda TaxID=64659 RepID=A0A9P5Y6R9_9AGAR|nr:nucleoporin Nup186/Nup192/Nup205 [Collybia nuda]